jgi:hypothetical protein
MIFLKKCFTFCLLLAVTGFTTVSVSADEEEFNQAELRHQNSTSTGTWNDLQKRLKFRFYTSFMGPNLGNSISQTYNVYLDRQAPLQNFYGTSVTYSINSDYSTGLRWAATHQFTGTVTSSRGTVSPEFHGYDPQLFFNLLNFWPNNYVYSFIQFHIQPPVVGFSRQNKMILSWGYYHSLGVKAIKAPWSGGIKVFITPFYYRDPYPYSRQTLYAYFGHFLNYSLHDGWQVSTSSIFDYERQTNNSKFLPNSPNRFRFGLERYQNKTLSEYGIYTQVLVRPSLDTTIVGFDFTITL